MKLPPLPYSDDSSLSYVIPLKPPGYYAPVLFFQLFFFCLLFSASAQDVEEDKFLTEADTLILQHRFEEAFDIYDRVIRQSKRAADWNYYFPAVRKKAALFYRLDQYEVGSVFLAPEISFYEKIFGSEANTELGELYLLLGDLQNRAREHDAAQASEDKALAIFEFLDEEKNIARALTLIGLNLHRMNRNPEALKKLHRALKILEIDPENNKLELGNCLKELGRIYKYDYQHDLAIDYMERSLTLAISTRDTPTIGFDYNTLAMLYQVNHDYQTSLEYNFKYYDVVEAYYGLVNEHMGFFYNIQGLTYFTIGDHKRAYDYWQRGHEIFAEVHGVGSRMATGLLMNTGNATFKSGQYDEALSIYQRVLKTLDQHRYPSFNYCHVRNNIFYFYLHMGDTINARLSFDAALEACKQNISPQALSWVEHYITKASLLQSPAEALLWSKKAFKQCVPNKENVTDLTEQDFAIHPNRFVLLKAIRAETQYRFQYFKRFQRGEDLDKAVAYAKKGLAFVDYCLRTQGSDESKLELLNIASKHLVVSATIGKTVFERNPNSESFNWLLEIAEKHKSLLLLEAISKKTISSATGIPEASLKEEAKLMTAIDELRLQITKAEGSNFDSVQAFTQLFDLRQQLGSLRDRFAMEYPNYSKTNYQHFNISAEEVQRALPNAQTALIEYLFDNSGLIILAITKDETKYAYQPLDSNFWTALQEFRQLIIEPRKALSEPQKEQQKIAFGQTAFSLYGTLLQPVLKDLPAIDQLIIIPDGQLGYLPFDLLLTDPVKNTKSSYRALPYLLRKYTTQNEYSFKLLAADHIPRNKSNAGLLAFAPQFGATVDASSRGTLDSFMFVRAYPGFKEKALSLAHNMPEANSIAEITNGRALTGIAATESEFKLNADEYSVLHLATHAFVNDLYPDYSYLVFAEDEAPNEDRFLYAYELHNMTLNADLAVLSACETGVGKLQRGEGIMSLSRAFKQAGCSSIVTSLWKAEDKSTKEFMVHFYDYLKDGIGKAEALRQAKLQYLDQTEQLRTHPFFWGTFILIGDNEPVHLSGTSKFHYLWLVGGLILLLGLGLFFNRRK